MPWRRKSAVGSDEYEFGQSGLRKSTQVLQQFSVVLKAGKCLYVCTTISLYYILICYYLLSIIIVTIFKFIMLYTIRLYNQYNKMHNISIDCYRLDICQICQSGSMKSLTILKLTTIIIAALYHGPGHTP